MEVNINKALFSELVRDAIARCEGELYTLLDKEDNDISYDIPAISMLNMKLGAYYRLLGENESRTDTTAKECEGGCLGGESTTASSERDGKQPTESVRSLDA